MDVNDLKKPKYMVGNGVVPIKVSTAHLKNKNVEVEFSKIILSWKIQYKTI